MFISVLDIFKVGVGPSSSHTMGPMVAAKAFADSLVAQGVLGEGQRIEVTLKGSLAYTGKGHATDRAVVLGLHGHTPESLIDSDIDVLMRELWAMKMVEIGGEKCRFSPETDIDFNLGKPLPQHANGLIMCLRDDKGGEIASETYFSIGGGFVKTLREIDALEAPIEGSNTTRCPYPFSTAKEMLMMAVDSNLSVADMKRANELAHMTAAELEDGLDRIWSAMRACVERGLKTRGTLPGGLNVARRAADLYTQLLEEAQTDHVGLSDWLCAYAMAVNEENAAGHMVVTAPTNGAAGVLPAVLYFFVEHENGRRVQVHDFLLTAAAIGGLIKHKSSISGAEVGCQGEVGSASSMAAAGATAVRGGTPAQVENAAEIALEHHLGLTCDPVAGLVQVPCIERNGFGAIKACTAASLARRGSGEHFMPLDACIKAMRETGEEMSHKFKETSQGGLAVSITEC